MIESPAFGLLKTIEGLELVGTVSTLAADPDTGKSIEPETIILRDASGKVVDYTDSPEIVRMRENLRIINANLASAHLTLQITDEQFAELEKRCATEGREPIDFTHNQLHRVFNNSSFDEDGRFYGGWWQNLPKEYRKYIELGRKHTVELDYSGHHVRILYAEAGLSPPDEAYDLKVFPRESQKQTMMIILNAKNRDSAIRAMHSKGIQNTKELASAMEERHAAISQHFYTCVAMRLMRADSDVAERVMLEMINRGAAVLPVHDSFIVRASREEELREMMELVFSEQFGKEARIKAKPNVYEASPEDKAEQLDKFVTSDLEALFKARENYKRTQKYFGS
jgi:bifunctional DNA-binding transcriptional regulator/antitoxin component of YhaV-PrlF toxin-antitoxin module